jgi:hypothetical protein
VKQKILVILFFAIISVSLAHAEVSYNSKGKTLTVKIEGQALTEVLNEVKEKTGIEVEIAEGVDGNIYQEFQNLSLENGLKRILKTKNYSFIYKGNSIKKIKLFPTGIPSASSTASASGLSSTSQPSSIPSQVSPGTVSRPSEVAPSISSTEISADMQKRLEERRMKFEERRRQREEMRGQREERGIGKESRKRSKGGNKD